MKHFYSKLLSFVFISSLLIAPNQSKAISASPLFQQTKAAPDNSIAVTADATAICEGETININLASSETGVDYQLTAGGANIGSPISGTGGEIHFPISPVNNTTYQVVATNTTTSETSTLTDEVSITVNPGPSLNLTVNASANMLCKGESVKISVENSEPGFTYLLNNGPDDFPPSIDGTGGTITFPQIAPESNTTYQVFVGGSTCFDQLKLTQTAVIDVVAAPATDLVVNVDHSSICPGETLTLSVENSELGVEYRVFDGSGYVSHLTSGTGGTINFLLSPAKDELYTVRAFGENCLSYVDLTQKRLVTVGTPPNVDITLNIDKDVICIGEEVIVGLDASETGVEYQLTDGTNDIGSPLTGDGNPIFFPPHTPATTTTYQVLVQNTVCSKSKPLTDTKSVTVIDQPDVNLVVNPVTADICVGEDILITIDNTETEVSYQLTDGTNNIGAAVNGNGGSLSFSVSPTATTTYEIEATRTSCPTQTLTNQSVITVSELPVLNLNVIATPAEVCFGDPTVISIENSELGVNYQLSDLNGTIGSAIAGTGSTLDFPPVTPLANNTYFVDAIKPECTNVYRVINDVDVTVKALPAPTIAYTVSPATICEGEIIQVNIQNSGMEINYTVFGTVDGLLGSGVGNGTDLSIYIKPISSQDIRMEAVSLGCSSPTPYPNRESIIVNPGPRLDLNVISDETSICESLNVPVTISVENSESGLSYWLKDDQGLEITSATGNGNTMNFSTVSPIETTTYTVETTMAGCNGRLDLQNTLEIQVSPLPDETIDLSISEPKICVGENTIISMSTSEVGVSYQLFDGTYNEGGPIDGTGSALSFPEFSPFRSKVYQVIATNTACGTTRTLLETIQVTVGLQPEEHLHPTIDKHTICEGEEVVISLTPSDPLVEYQLFDGDTPIGPALHGNSIDIDFTPTSPATSTTYRIEALGQNCVDPIDIKYTVDVTVHHKPATNKELFANRDTICKGEEVLLGVKNSEDGIFYQLFDGNSFIEPNVVGNGGTIEFPVQTLSTNTTYQVFAHETVCTDQLPMNNTKDVTVLSFDPLPLESLATPDEICDGESIDIELPTSVDGVEYILFDGNTEVQSITGDGNPVVFTNITPQENSNIEITIGNCRDELVVARPDYTLHSNPSLQILTKDVQNGYDGDLVISVTNGTPPFTYIIDPGETITSDSRVLELKKQQTGSYQILVVDNNACRSSDAGQLAEIKIDEDVQIIVNNALTPNGDGINDEWFIHYDSALGNPEVYIFNIYGQQIYHSTSYQNDWKGTHNGSALPNGAYYYLIEFDSKDIKPIKGSLSILGN
eukprot:TRINITY_DN2294_c1_g1_i7.p1 TRINITY_DN2294_c1_g1~~TRINITY_DN2294_c1_g1_i7.p1  ORF type:complete len:1309 (-),score=97.63 TRINITY_DN2294_c1_g1_i7:4895-8821(-)